MFITDRNIDSGKAFDWGRMDRHGYFRKSDRNSKKTVCRNEYRILCTADRKA